MFGTYKTADGTELIVTRYILYMFRGPNWDPLKPPLLQDGILEHLAYWYKLIEQGYCIAGPYREFDDAVVLFTDKVTTYEQAEQLNNGDPWAQNQTTVSVIRPWITSPYTIELQLSDGASGS
jgi:hypothetical protein